MNRSTTVPATALTRRPIPAMTAIPIAIMASMKRMSVVGLAIAAKNPLSGPLTAGLFRNPWLGAPPLIHDDLGSVEKQSPKVFSRNAQRKMNPVASRRTASERLPAILVTIGASAAVALGRTVGMTAGMTVGRSASEVV